MQITCPNCRKSFLVKDELIPIDGRQLQCGKCFNQWFFKKISSNDAREIKKIDNDYKLSKTSTIQNIEKNKKKKTKEFNFDIVYAFKFTLCTVLVSHSGRSAAW